MEKPSSPDPRQFIPPAIDFLTGAALRRIVQLHGLVVQSGPFAGMTYTAECIGNNIVPKLLGSYETNLHPIVEDLIARSPAAVLNIGAAEGYYAVGLARRLPGVHVSAFEMNPESQVRCRVLAAANGVMDRITIEGQCNIEDLNCRCAARPFILCDCEGAEIDLLDPQRVPHLKHCEMLVELHDFTNPAITPTLLNRFESSHQIHVQLDSGRNVHAYPALRQMGELYQLMAIHEGRPCSMSWAHLMPR